MAGTIVADTIQDGAGNSTAMDNAIYGSAKAWVTWNGNGVGTILASYNVSSVTYRSTGLFTINFTNAFSDANYTVAGCPAVNPGNAGGYLGVSDNTVGASTTACGVYTVNSAAALSNYSRISASFIR